MVTELSSLSQLDATKVATLLTQLTEEVQEDNADLDVKRGVFHDTVLYFHAVLESAIRDNLDRYQTGRSLRQIELDPAVADADTVNDILSNWGITRKEGTQAKGTVVIVVSESTSVTISSGATFEANGVVFSADNSYTSTTNTASTTENDRLLTELSDGNYMFTIFVTANTDGPTGKLNVNTVVVPNNPISNYVTSYAASDFSDGISTETNTELMQQLQDGISAKALSNRVNMRGLLRSLSQFSSITNQSIVGYGDSEMLRDQHSIFPISYGGRVDWYIRGEVDLNTVGLDKEATLMSIDTSTNRGTWQFTVIKDDAPGFYEIRSILPYGATPVGAETFSITSEIRDVDLTGTGLIPDITIQQEGSFTSYQTATIQFLDSETDTTALTVGDKKNYSITVAGSGHTKELQDYFGSRDARCFGSDILVKAPVPCFVQVSMTVNKSFGDADPAIDDMKNAIAAVVNGTGFIGRLDGSRILEVANTYIQNNVSITQLDLVGRIFTPDYTNAWIRSNDSLVIPSTAGVMVSAKTVQFFIGVEDISINVETSIPTFS